ncbi:hypothetical protein [Streptomyces antimicrobicus]|uniref:HEAT repeat domain-containing protein n=1 Tax=Streptomyces antimicrobicus TaxID=2883108 RepID=A0ABS8B219_9ACTN|nr:hypothetical protein [Streptomyces antimicrobicus]MCB5178651.1 hypothetical protein [Streptomyces antimicrobicus]
MTADPVDVRQGGPGSPQPAATADDKEHPKDKAEEKGRDKGEADGTEEAAQEQQKPQDAWDTQRDLHRHAPRSLRFRGTNHGVFAGSVAGGVTINNFGPSGPLRTSGEMPPADLAAETEGFVRDGTRFDVLLDRLRRDPLLVLDGARATGRRTAALMLLRELGATPVHVIDRKTAPQDIAGHVRDGKAGGYVLCDLVTSPDKPLRESHVLALRDALRDHGAFLVVTTGLRPWVEEDVPTSTWHPPAAGPLLRRRLDGPLASSEVDRLMARPVVTDFVAREPQPREVVAYAGQLVRYARGEVDENTLEQTSLEALERQVQEWFEADETTVHLREKAFLIAQAVFDDGPYALTAELSDLLFLALQKTVNSELPSKVPVFGTNIGKRLQLGRVRGYEAEEPTEWGPVVQRKTAFHDNRTAPVLLQEVWIGHPSARPALVAWLDRLVEDRRPFVRTRAAATVAALASADLPSAMALIVERWAVSRNAQRRTGAVSSLVLAHEAGAPNVLRIVDDWTTGEDPQRCWVGVRAQGLLGKDRPEAAFAQLRIQARRQYGKTPDPLLAGELAQSVEVLLLSEAAPRVLAEVLRTLDDHKAVRRLSMDGFLRACGHTADGPGSCPLVLGQFAQARAAGGPAAEAVPRLWRYALGDRALTSDALDRLTAWVRAADTDPRTESALADLLPTLIGDTTDLHRVQHLLATVRGEDGGPRPAVADRLSALLPRP